MKEDILTSFSEYSLDIENAVSTLLTELIPVQEQPAVHAQYHPVTIEAGDLQGVIYKFRQWVLMNDYDDVINHLTVIMNDRGDKVGLTTVVNTEGTADEYNLIYRVDEDVYCSVTSITQPNLGNVISGAIYEDVNPRLQADIDAGLMRLRDVPEHSFFITAGFSTTSAEEIRTIPDSNGMAASIMQWVKQLHARMQYHISKTPLQTMATSYTGSSYSVFATHDEYCDNVMIVVFAVIFRIPLHMPACFGICITRKEHGKYRLYCSGDKFFSSAQDEFTTFAKR